MAAIKGRQVKQMFKESGNRLGAFESTFKRLLGVREDPITGRRYIDKKERQLGPEEFSIRDLTEQFLGYEFISELHGGPPSGDKAAKLAMALNETTKARLLMEDVAAVGPSIFQDINAWNASVAGLVEVRLLESYNAEDFIGDEFVQIEPTRVNGGKMQGISYIAPAGEVTTPGVEFPNVGMNEMWVWARPNMVYGMKLSLDRNTVVYDLGGELMGRAESIGKGLGYGRDYYIGAGVMGVTQVTPQNGFPKPSLTNQIGNSFRMNQTVDSTPNATYQTAGVTTNPYLKNAYNFINKQASTSFTDWTSLQKVQSLLNLMRDPVNLLPFKTEIKQVLVDPALWQLALYIKHQTQVFNATGTPAVNYNGVVQGTGSTFPPVGTFSPDFGGDLSQINQWMPHKSNIWHQILLDSGISEANAETYWWAGDAKKAFVWRSAWDTRVDQANPSSADLLGKNIVNEWVAQWSGQFVVREPRYMVYSTP